MDPKHCEICGKGTFKQYVLHLTGKRRPRTVKAWLCDDACASTYFEGDII